MDNNAFCQKKKIWYPFQPPINLVCTIDNNIQYSQATATTTIDCKLNNR